MDRLYQQVISTKGEEACIKAALDDCNQFSDDLITVLLLKRGTKDNVAIAISRMEIACALMRLIVGSELVDLCKVSELARLQHSTADCVDSPVERRRHV